MTSASPDQDVTREMMLAFGATRPNHPLDGRRRYAGGRVDGQVDELSNLLAALAGDVKTLGARGSG